MKTLLLILGLTFFMCTVSLCQKQAILYSSRDIGKTRSAAFEKIRVPEHGRFVKIRHADGTKSKILKDSLWGYSDNKGRIYRLYKNRSYRVFAREDYIKYSYSNSGGLTGLHAGKYMRYSKTLDSKIVTWKKQALAEH